MKIVSKCDINDHSITIVPENKKESKILNDAVEGKAKPVNPRHVHISFSSTCCARCQKPIFDDEPMVEVSLVRNGVKHSGILQLHKRCADDAIQFIKSFPSAIQAPPSVEGEDE